MNLAQQLKVEHAVSAQVVTNTSATSAAIDTKDALEGAVIVNGGAAPTGTVGSVKLTECDTSGGTYTDVANSTQSWADSDDNKSGIIRWKPARHKRFVKVVVTNAAAQNWLVSASVVLSDREIPVAQTAKVTDADSLS